MRAVFVVVPDVDPQDPLEVAAAEERVRGLLPIDPAHGGLQQVVVVAGGGFGVVLVDLLFGQPGLAVVAVWVLARAVELPGPNPWLPLDTVAGFTDAVCAALEAVAAVLLAVAAARWPRGPRVHHPALVAAASAAALLLAAILAAAGVALATDGFTSVTRAGGPLPVHPRPGTVTTVTYCTQHGSGLAMDVYEPPATAARPAPVALYVHGGGFTLGDRKLRGLGATLANHTGALLPRLRAALNQRGFVVASIDYRLPPLSPWPAQIQDAKCAVRFLRAHAGALGVDPARIGVWGSSGGGTLVALLGLAGPQAGFDHGPYAEQPSGVQAVVDMFGPSDLTNLTDSSPFDRLVARLALGNSASVRHAASPLSYAGAAGGPPFLILHGSEDKDMPPRQSRQLAARLHAAEVPVRLVLVQGAGHGLDDPSQWPTPTRSPTWSPTSSPERWEAASGRPVGPDAGQLATSLTHDQGRVHGAVDAWQAPPHRARGAVALRRPRAN